MFAIPLRRRQDYEGHIIDQSLFLVYESLAASAAAHKVKTHIGIHTCAHELVRLASAMRAFCAVGMGKSIPCLGVSNLLSAGNLIQFLYIKFLALHDCSLLNNF